MEESSQQEREARAARNQSLFRAVNERMRDLSEKFQVANKTFVVACECADGTCVEMIDISREEYEAVRAEPRHFVVRPEHVLHDVERVVGEKGGYAVVEKVEAAGEVAEALDTRS